MPSSIASGWAGIGIGVIASFCAWAGAARAQAIAIPTAASRAPVRRNAPITLRSSFPGFMAPLPPMFPWIAAESGEARLSRQEYVSATTNRKEKGRMFVLQPRA